MDEFTIKFLSNQPQRPMDTNSSRTQIADLESTIHPSETKCERGERLTDAKETIIVTKYINF